MAGMGAEWNFALWAFGEPELEGCSVTIQYIDRKDEVLDAQSSNLRRKILKNCSSRWRHVNMHRGNGRTVCDNDIKAYQQGHPDRLESENEIQVDQRADGTGVCEECVKSTKYHVKITLGQLPPCLVLALRVFQYL